MYKKSIFSSSAKNSVFYIAEIGGNHEGDYNYAKRLARLAIDSGADAVKFQFYTGDTLVSHIEDGNRNAHFKKFELTNDQNLDLMNMVEIGGAIPMASVWSADMLKWADPHLSIHKVGSGDLTCYPMLKALAATGKPIILSTGLSSLSEVADSVAYIEKCNPSYISERKLALLQCTSSYPTPDDDANLDAMLTLKSEFGLPVGYSDHTLPDENMTPLVTSYLLGAKVIEKHFTHDKLLPGNDHYHSMDIHDLKNLKSILKKVDILKGGENIKKPISTESVSRLNARRSIVLVKNVEAGHVLTELDLICKRPGTGISPLYWDDVIGCVVLSSIKEDSTLQWNDLQKKI